MVVADRITDKLWDIPDGSKYDQTKFYEVEERQPPMDREEPSTIRGETSASGTVSSADMPSWLMEKLSSIHPFINMQNAGGGGAGLINKAAEGMAGGVGATVGGVLGGVGGGAVTRTPQGALAGNIMGSMAGQTAQDYLTTEGPNMMSTIGSGALAAISPLAVGAKNAGAAVLRKVPVLNDILESVGFPKNLKEAAYAAGEPINLDKTWLAAEKASTRGASSLSPSVIKEEAKTTQNLKDLMIGRSPAGTNTFSPEDAEYIRMLIGKLQNSRGLVTNDIADPLYLAVMRDLRDAAAAGNASARRLLQSGVENNALKAAESGFTRVPLLGAGLGTSVAGLGIGMGLSGIANHPKMALAAGLGIPGLVSGANLYKEGVKNFNPYVGGGAGGGIRAFIEDYLGGQ